MKLTSFDSFFLTQYIAHAIIAESKEKS